VLPEHSEVDVELRDGESIAIDWHFEVYETVLDTVRASTVRRHAASMVSTYVVCIVYAWCVYSVVLPCVANHV